MGREIERKFLVSDESWRRDADEGRRIRQAYLAFTESASVRVRILGNAEAVLTVKSAATGAVRDEYEYPIPVADAEAMLALRQGHLIEKTRYRIPRGGHVWEVDVFSGDNEGLTVAEIELSGEDEGFERPAWIGQEVTRDMRYTNAALAQRPYRDS
jgi:adenylate cyclase